jgi:tRNA-splicing ligase RtcB
LQGIHAAANFGFVNRMAMTEALRTSLGHHFGDTDGKARLVVDCSHVTIQKETHRGEELWIHRHGSNVALPPSRCVEHPLWRHTGQPIPVPGSMGDDSYLAVGVEGNEATYHSANHGAGRVLDKPQALARWSENDVEREMARRKIRLIRGGTMSIAEQAPGSFKNVGAVMAAMQEFRIAAPVARLRPLAVLKG